MRLIYIICILFTTTICCIATDNANATEGDIKTTNQQIADPVSKAAPLDNSTSPDKIANASIITTNNNSSINITTPTVVPTNATIVNVNANVTNKTTPNDNHTNTDPPKESSTTAATIATESTITTTTEKPTTTPTVTSTNVPNNRSNNSVAPEVSTVSVSPKTVPTSPSSSQGRMFDGLSFVGGIICTICSIGIVALSWKFYRSISDGNYHIL
ncbi:hypothetical protein ANTPLA_LOCUS9882 [Anthophora plagiata]